MTRARYVNGRILTRDHGGVHRYATEISRHLDDATVLQPRMAARAWSGRVWEQTTLPRVAGDGVLLNMAHSAPLRHRRQINVVHDLLALTDPRGVHPGYAALLRRQLPRYVASARRVVTVSSHVAEQVASNFEIALSDISVVPPGISTVFRRVHPNAARGRLGLNPERPVVAALLDPVPRKNAAAVAALLHELQAEIPDLQVVVAGRRQAPHFARTRQTNPAERDGFVDLGAAADIELATMYQAADVFVSLSSGEGFGLPVVEAAMCGAAVVTRPVPSMTEHGPDAAVIVHDADQAKTAVRSLLGQPARRHELTQAAAETLGDLQWQQSAATLGTMMSEVAAT